MEPFYNPNTLEVGIDESGRGSLIDRVYVGAVILPPDLHQQNNSLILNDSKKLSKRKRLIYKDYIEENAIDYNISYMDNLNIDKINILQATLQTMHSVLDKLNVEPEFIIIDGDYFLPYKNIPYKCIKNGDNIYASIAAASILAKVYHDKRIEELCNEYPELDHKYDLLNNMGYGTKKHLEGIKKFGISKFHRKSFSPCKI